MGLSREMHDGVGFGHQALDQCFVGQVTLDEADVVGDGRQGLLAAGVGQGVQNGDGMAPGHSTVDEVRPDEPRTPGDQ